MFYLFYNALETTIVCPLGGSPMWNHAETSRAETPGGQQSVVKIASYVKQIKNVIKK